LNHFTRLVLSAGLLAGATVAAGPSVAFGPVSPPAGISYLQRVAVYGDKDHRRTEPEWAKQTGQSLETVRDRYAATGKLICGGRRATAQLTISNDIITTAAHVVRLKDGCATIDPRSCSFEVTTPNGLREYRVGQLVARGACAANASRLATMVNDWAVLKLERPVDGVAPYRVDANKTLGLWQGDRVVNVAHSVDFTRRTGPVEHPKHIAECTIHNLAPSAPPRVIATDCDAAQGASGGSLLSDPGGEAEPILIGVLSGTHETPRAAAEAGRRGRPTAKPFDLMTWSTVHVALSHEFLDAVLRAAHQEPAMAHAQPSMQIASALLSAAILPPAMSQSGPSSGPSDSGVRKLAFPSASSAPESNPTWNRQVYDRAQQYWSKIDKATGTAPQPVVTFVLNRSGAVLSAQVTTSSGDATLDQKAEAAVRTASPFPEAPAIERGEVFTFAVPMR
jgi:TonB family protein